MDGVKELYNFATTFPEYSRIYYGPDPILNKFDTEKHLFYYSKTVEYIEIKVWNLLYEVLSWTVCN